MTNITKSTPPSLADEESPTKKWVYVKPQLILLAGANGEGQDDADYTVNSKGLTVRERTTIDGDLSGPS